jgi:translation initiation factor eIF-2B subunit epsilon
LSAESVSTLASSDDEEELSDFNNDADEGFELHHRRSSRGSITTLSDDGGSLLPGGGTKPSHAGARGAASKESEFHIDAVSSIYDSLTKNDSEDVVQLELVGLRMSNNASEREVRRAIATAFVKRIVSLISPSAEEQAQHAPKPIAEAVATVVGNYQQLVKRSIFDHNRAGERPDQVDFLLALQRELVSSGEGKAGTVLLFISQKLYELELVEEEGFEGWWKDPRSAGTSTGTAGGEAAKKEMANVRSGVEQFMEWLRNAEEEDSDEDSD